MPPQGRIRSAGHEVLRLRYELKLGYQQIGRSTVHKYLKGAEAVGLTWPLPEGWDEARVEAALSPRTGKPVAKTRLFISDVGRSLVACIGP